MIELQPDEHIILEARGHWFIIALEILGYLVLLALPYILYPYIHDVELSLPQGSRFSLAIDPAFGVFISGAWTLVIWMRVVGAWTDYYLDVWTITNKRVLDIEQKGMFHRKTSIFRIERIQDVTIEVKGIIATLLNYGDIHVQTAGEGQEFIMRDIARPKHVRQVILKQHDRVTELAPRTPVRPEDSV